MNHTIKPTEMQLLRRSIPPPEDEILQYFEHTIDEVALRTESPRIRLLQQKVNEIRSSEEIGVKYMLAWEEKLLEKQEAREEGLAEGRAEGRAEERSAIARKMLAAGIDIGMITDFTGLTREDVESL